MIKEKNFRKLSLERADLNSIDYDSSWMQVNSEEFIKLEHCFGVVAYCKYSYVIRRHSNGFITSNEFWYCIRIIDSEDVDGVYSFFIAPAFKPEDDMSEKLRLPTERNKIELVRGEVVAIEDLPKTQFDYSNSVYDPKLKRRVFVLPQENKPEVPKLKLTKTVSEDGLINNQDTNKEEGKFSSSDFLEPHVCTRLWVLSKGTETGWAWFWKDVDGFKHKKEYYCRPIELGKTFWDIQYDRGGAQVTKAFFKKQFPNLCNSVLEHGNIKRLLAEFSDSNKVEINCVIDSFLIKW